ncbi:hypothetical protein K2173_002990 [Erythroxylum novogranatense]|uniref:Uncharacterized protein n=1 Tax=Erythroxylum novogranatense TaxID=1862640 RepID=A0AAV8S8H6_9ROSI|nr:hypothetical protein K2173_002990 [Erythroxylum novogranatense]
MKSLLSTSSFDCSIVPSSIIHSCVLPASSLSWNSPISSSSSTNPVVSSLKRYLHVSTASRSQSPSNRKCRKEDEDDPEAYVQVLRVPDHWLLPSKALEESKWLRVNLHKWLDDEYCPEETNVEISQVAAQSYYEALLDKQTDLGVILLKMARALESISYQESFHGAFSSANAAVNLIAHRIELQC